MTLSSWYTQSGKNSDVIITSRIRLARNIAGVPFGSRLTDEEKNCVSHRGKALNAILEYLRDKYNEN